MIHPHDTKLLVSYRLREPRTLQRRGLHSSRSIASEIRNEKPFAARHMEIAINLTIELSDVQMVPATWVFGMVYPLRYRSR